MLREVKHRKARQLVSAASTAGSAHRRATVDRRSAAAERLKRRLEVRTKAESPARTVVAPPPPAEMRARKPSRILPLASFATKQVASVPL